MQTIVYVQGMHCRSCEIRIEEALVQIPWVQKVQVNHATGKVTIHHRPKREQKLVQQKIQDIGYSIGQNQKPRLTNDKSVYIHVGVSIVIVWLLAYLLIANDATQLLTIDPKTSGRTSMFLVWLIAWLSTCMAVVWGILVALAAKRSEEHQDKNYSQRFRPQIFFHIGRLVAFVVFWWLLWLIGSALQLSDWWYLILFVAVWGVMLLSWLQLTDIFPRLSWYHISFPKSIQAILRKRWEDKGMMIESAITGWATFFVPCGFTIIAQAYAATTGNFWLGSATMGAFAIGTLPGLLSIGWLTAALQGTSARMIFRGLGVLLVVFAWYNFSLANNYWIGIQQTNVPEVVQSIPDDQKPLVQVSIIQDGNGYIPNTVTIPKNSKIALTIDSQDQYTCASSFRIPAKNIRMLLNPGKNNITFTTDNEDKIIFGCSMMMYKGVFIVQ